MGTGALKRGPTKQHFERKVREKALQTDYQTEEWSQSRKQPKDPKMRAFLLLLKEQCENGMLFSEIRETEVKGESVVMILEKKNERKMNAYAKTRSMLSHLPLQVIWYLYTLLNKKEKKKNKNLTAERPRKEKAQLDWPKGNSETV